jgi:nitrate/nitrite-specific signal transduction histidine kinase
MEQELANHSADLEEEVGERTKELRTIVNAMAGRENRMAELKEVITTLREQLENAGMTPTVSISLAKKTEAG